MFVDAGTIDHAIAMDDAQDSKWGRITTLKFDSPHGDATLLLPLTPHAVGLMATLLIEQRDKLLEEGLL